MGKERKQEVLDLVDRIIRELAYIEALRERFQRPSIQTKLSQVVALHRNDRQFITEIQQVKTLIDRRSRSSSSSLIKSTRRRAKSSIC